MKNFLSSDFVAENDVGTKVPPHLANGEVVTLPVGQFYTAPLTFPDGVAPRLSGQGSANRFNHGEFTRLMALGTQDYLLCVGGANTSPTVAEWGGWIERLALGGSRAVVNGQRLCDGLVIREGQATRAESLSLQNLRRGIYVLGERRVQTLAFRDISVWDCDVGVEIVGATSASYSHSDTVLDTIQIETFGAGAKIGLKLDSAGGGVYANGVTIQAMSEAGIVCENNSRLWYRGYLEVANSVPAIIARNNSTVVVEAGVLASGYVEADATSTIIIREGVWSRSLGLTQSSDRRIRGRRELV